MRSITRTDPESGETLMWCGGEDFDIIQAQRTLNETGMALQSIREDKWGIVGPAEPLEEYEEAPNGR